MSGRSGATEWKTLTFRKNPGHNHVYSWMGPNLATGAIGKANRSKRDIPVAGGNVARSAVRGRGPKSNPWHIYYAARFALAISGFVTIVALIVLGR